MRELADLKVEIAYFEWIQNHLYKGGNGFTQQQGLQVLLLSKYQAQQK